MAKLAHLLRLRGTRSTAPQAPQAAQKDPVVAQDAPAPAPVAAAAVGTERRESERRPGMHKAGGKLRKHAAETAIAASNEEATLLSVEALQPGSDSGVYVVETNSEPKRDTRAMNPLLEHVTLIVYGWKNVEPGTLSWVFPSVGAAVAAARAMKNAVKWAIVAGRRNATEEQLDDDLAKAREHGAVLIEEQAG